MPARERHAVRAILLTPDNCILIMRYDSPGRSVWITLGGGLIPGEEAIAGLRRELAEETLRDGWDIGPEVWTRTVVFEIRGDEVTQHERIFLVPTPHFEPPADMPDEEERQVFGGFRWWHVDKIEASRERFAPQRLAALLRRLIDAGPPPAPEDVGR